ncbi:MAG: GtrA family protein [Candidatus Amulumruptor caecigallinarius]|nr:GtrA family protein [Candidatus Amulumruptor caecigallinarius]MCM1396334.1 GtrA family protein [Candidatus Amulumruptor caecigallinarius]MCM1453724.1 GtrA family protein [bacterium]
MDFGLLALLTEYAGFSYQLSACLSFTAGLTINYLLSIVWVFGSAARSQADHIIEFVSFGLIGLVGLGMNALIMWFFTELCGVHYLVSKIISTIIVFFWNFLARRSLITYLPLASWRTILTNRI